MTEPTVAELVRRLDESSRQIRDLLEELRRDRATYEQIFVRRDVYEAHRTQDVSAVEDIEERMRAAEAFRRQIMAGAAVQVIGVVIALALLVAGVRGGGV